MVPEKQDSNCIYEVQVQELLLRDVDEVACLRHIQVELLPFFNKDDVLAKMEYNKHNVNVRDSQMKDTQVR